MGDGTGGLHSDQLHVNAVWQMLSTIMWLVWVVTAVAAAMPSKRSLQVLEEQASRHDTEAQMVGFRYRTSSQAVQSLESQLHPSRAMAAMGLMVQDFSPLDPLSRECL